jgi:hypothetical protein
MWLQIAGNVAPTVAHSADVAPIVAHLNMKGGKKLKVTPNKPDAPMIGADGNVFAQLGIAGRALRENGQGELASEMSARVMGCDSYNKALSIICEYVNPVEKGEKQRNRER